MNVARDPLGGRREATVYGRGRTYVVTSERRSGYGGSYRSPPYFLVRRSAADGDLGACVMEAIEGFTYVDEVPSESDLEAADAELFALVGVKDEVTFARGASLVEIVERANQWVVEPWGRARGGWYPLNEETYLHLSAPSSRALGVAVRQAFVTLRGLP